MLKKLKSKNILEAEYIIDGGKMLLDLPFIKDEDLPTVSVVTITKNRKNIFNMALNNWKRFIYPYKKIEWVILDDSDLETNDLSDIIPSDSRIIYKKCENMKIGDKRNKSIEFCNNEYIVIMDDDDFYFPDSVLAKIRVLLKYKKDCVYSNNLGIYDIRNNSSAILYDYNDIPEASLAFKKSFWCNNKFKNNDSGYESYNMVISNEKRIIKISFWFNLIACTHNKNITNRLRCINVDKKNPNFFDLVFDKDTKIIINDIKNSIV